MAMAKKRSSTTLADRACRLLRLALLWTRKGGVLPKRLVHDFKRLRAASNRSYMLGNGEREFSFDDETPRASHFRMLQFSCLHPSVDFDDDRDNVDIFCRNKNDSRDDGSCESVTDDNVGADDADIDTEATYCDANNEEEAREEGIDLRAEEFISRFYEQMKLQRQISLLRYNEMLCRGM